MCAATGEIAFLVKREQSVAVVESKKTNTPKEFVELICSKFLRIGK
jgi:hypothetical protein